MGYFVTITSADFLIPDTPEVLSAIHEMDTKFDAIKCGGSYGPESKTEKCFSRMPKNLSDFTTVRDVFKALGFDVSDADNGGFYLQGYNNKTGQENLFLAVVAPFVEDGSYTEWLGEDGERYRFVVVNGRLHTQSAFVTWGTPERIYIRHYDFAVGSHMIVDPYQWEAVSK